VTRPRRLSAILAALIVGAGILVTAGYFILRGSIQPRGGTLLLPGLEQPVDVSWDEWAIPTIIGRTEEDALRAQGFVHAGERLWQLELFQRIARGRLAELFGEAAIGTDRVMRTLDLWSAAGRAEEALSPRTRALLEAYAEGVNARIDSWRGPLPPEFLVLGIRPQAWSPRASLAIAGIMALDLAGWQGELDRLETLSRIPAALRATLARGYPEWGPTIMQDGVSSVPAADGSGADGATAVVARTGGAADRETLKKDREARARVDPLGLLRGIGLRASNSWAVGGSRTADGHPLLANDMHLSLRAPSTWFVNAIHASDDGLHVAGVSIPGAPGVVVGLNRQLAWGFTNAMVDDGDFVVESVNLDGTMYRAGDEWVPFGTRTERIEVRGGETVELVVRETVRGPVITDVMPSGGLTLSLLWTGLTCGGAAEALLGMNRANDADAFRQALMRFGSPHQNVIYATTAGELGYRLVGSIPDRGPLDGSRPISFERLPHGWEGFWPPDSMPALRRPPSDYLASANNLQSRALFGVVGSDYPLPYRARRIDDVVSAARDWTPEDMLRLQLDTHSLWADRLLPRAAAAARRIGREDEAEALLAWDRRVDREARQAVPFYAWLFGLRQRIAADELDGEGWFPDLALERILSAGDDPWVDDVDTPERETLEDLEDEAMRAALDVAGDLTWGEAHVEQSVHPLGRVAWLDRIFRFRVGPSPAPGARHTVRPDEPYRWSALDSTSWTPPFVSEYGPSERFIAHLSPADPTGRFFLPTGQSGNPLDLHYRDMTDRWIEGGMAVVSLDLQAQRARQASELHLEPLEQPARSGGESP